jgi:hypothetical protein
MHIYIKNKRERPKENGKIPIMLCTSEIGKNYKNDQRQILTGAIRDTVDEIQSH